MSKQIERNDEIEIDLKELLYELSSHWKMILLSTVLVAAILFSYSKFIVTPKYSATSTLYVLTKSTSITSLADLQTGTNLTQDYMEVVGSRPVLEQVIDNLDLDMNYKELSAKLAFENPNNSRLLKITAMDEDPEMAKKIVDEVATVSAAYIAEKMMQDPPTIIQYGYADGDPVSPNIQKNTLLGAGVGFFLAVAIIIISYLLNDTIMTPEDMERKIGLKVLASLPLTEEEQDSYKGNKKRKK